MFCRAGLVISEDEIKIKFFLVTFSGQVMANIHQMWLIDYPEYMIRHYPICAVPLLMHITQSLADIFIFMRWLKLISFMVVEDKVSMSAIMMQRRLLKT